MSIRDAAGTAYSVTTAGETLFSASAAAIKFFEQDYWKGPKPLPQTVLEVQTVGANDAYHVKPSRIRPIIPEFT